MNCVELIAPESGVAAPEVCGVRLPMGLLGFEEIKDYLLIANPDEEPFRWLQVKENTALAFVVIEPFLVVPDYHPDIPEPDVQFLGLARPEDALLYSIVTLHGANNAPSTSRAPWCLTATRSSASKSSLPMPANTQFSMRSRQRILRHKLINRLRHAHSLSQIRRKHRH